MQSNNASAETSSCLSSNEARRRAPPPPPTYSVGAAVPQIGVMSPPPNSLRHLLSLQQAHIPTLLFLIDDTDGTVTARLPLFQLPHQTSPPVRPYQHQSDGSRMVYLQGILDEALNICDDFESIIKSEPE